MFFTVIFKKEVLWRDTLTQKRGQNPAETTAHSATGTEVTDGRVWRRAGTRAPRQGAASAPSERAKNGSDTEEAPAEVVPAEPLPGEAARVGEAGPGGPG